MPTCCHISTCSSSSRMQSAHLTLQLHCLPPSLLPAAASLAPATLSACSMQRCCTMLAPFLPLQEQQQQQEQHPVAEHLHRCRCRCCLPCPPWTPSTQISSPSKEAALLLLEAASSGQGGAALLLQCFVARALLLLLPLQQPLKQWQAAVESGVDSSRGRGST